MIPAQPIPITPPPFVAGERVRLRDPRLRRDVTVAKVFRFPGYDRWFLSYYVRVGDQRYTEVGAAELFERVTG